MRRTNPCAAPTSLFPVPGPGQVLIQVHACAVCRTDLHVVDGELTQPKLPLIPGHEIIGRVSALGDSVERFALGDRVGVPWLGWTCGVCEFCRSGRENLCDNARFTGYQIDGGYAEFAVADQRFCFAIPDSYTDAEAAPLLCAGLIGYRSLRMAGDARRLGLYGFGAAAHIIAQVARWQGREVYAFTSPGDTRGARLRTRTGGHLGERFGSAATRTAGCRDHLRAGGGPGAGGTARCRARRQSGLRRHPHESDPELPLRHTVGRTAGPLGRQPDAGSMARSSCNWHPKFPCGHDRCLTRSSRRTRRSMTCAPAGCKVPRCSRRRKDQPDQRPQKTEAGCRSR